MFTYTGSNPQKNFPTLDQVISTLKEAPKTNAIKIHLDQTSVSPTYFMTDEEKRNVGGPCGYIGCSNGSTYSDLTPEKALLYKFTVAVPIEQLDKVQNYLTEQKTPFKVNTILLSQTVTQKLVKKPWYTAVIKAIQLFNPHFDKAQINGLCFTDEEGTNPQYDEDSMTRWMCSLDHDVKREYDESNRLIEFNFMNSEILDKLNSVSTIWTL